MFRSTLVVGESPFTSFKVIQYLSWHILSYKFISCLYAHKTTLNMGRISVILSWKKRNEKKLGRRSHVIQTISDGLFSIHPLDEAIDTIDVLQHSDEVRKIITMVG